MPFFWYKNVNFFLQMKMKFGVCGIDHNPELQVNYSLKNSSVGMCSCSTNCMFFLLSQLCLKPMVSKAEVMFGILPFSSSQSQRKHLNFTLTNRVDFFKGKYCSTFFCIPQKIVQVFSFQFLNSWNLRFNFREIRFSNICIHIFMRGSRWK